jgi:hypothetical protein
MDADVERFLEECRTFLTPEELAAAERVLRDGTPTLTIVPNGKAPRIASVQQSIHLANHCVNGLPK